MLGRRRSSAQVRRPRLAREQRPRQQGDVEAGVVVPAPRASAAAAPPHAPHLCRTLVFSAGGCGAVAVHAVLSRGVLAVEAPLGGVGLVDVEHVEPVAQEEAPEP